MFTIDGGETYEAKSMFNYSEEVFSGKYCEFFSKKFKVLCVIMKKIKKINSFRLKILLLLNVTLQVK